MSHPQYQTFQGDQPASPNPPTYSEKELCKDPDPAGSALPTGQGAAVPMPPSYGLPSPAYQPLNIQPQQTILLTPIYPSVEPDYLAYSIFTMLFCCLPLGIAALIFSIKTRDANHFGNVMAAQRNSKLARNFSHAALGFGIAVLVMNITILVTLYLLNKP